MHFSCLWGIRIHWRKSILLPIRQEPSQQESQEIGKSIELAIESDVPVSQLDAVLHIGIFIAFSADIDNARISQSLHTTNVIPALFLALSILSGTNIVIFTLSGHLSHPFSHYPQALQQVDSIRWHTDDTDLTRWAQIYSFIWISAKTRCLSPCGFHPYWNRVPPLLEPGSTRIGTGFHPYWNGVSSVL